MSITVMTEARASSTRRRAERVDALTAALAAEVAWLDGSIAQLSGREAAALARSFSTLSRLAGAGVTLAAGRVAAMGYYREAGARTARQWLSSETGVTAGEAGRTISTADAGPRGARGDACGIGRRLLDGDAGCGGGVGGGEGAE